MAQERGPESLFEFIVMIIKAYITGIPSIIKSMIVSAVLSAVVTNVIHFYLMGWVNNGWNNAGNPWLDPVIFITGQGPAKVMLFYFMITYLFWWVIGMFRSRGIGPTIKMTVTAPIWIIKSLTTIGFAVLPMLMGGLAVSFVLGLTVLTNPTAITMFLMMITVLISQDESLIIMGLQLGFKDISGLLNRGKPSPIPDPLVPSAAIVGAGIGFGYIAFLKPSTTIIGGIALLTVAGLVYMFIRNRRSPAIVVVATLFVLVTVVTIMAPMVLADDGGIPENGGWSNLPNMPWLIQELIRKGYPASIAAALAASIISGMFSPPVLSKIKPLGEGYVDKTYRDPVDDGRVQHWRWVKVDSDGHVTDADGQQWQKQWSGKGLPKAIVDAEDSPMLGDRVRIWTQEPPADTSTQDNIADGIVNLGRTHVDKLHPDNWKDLTAAQRGDVLREVNKVLQKELGVDYSFEVSNQPDRPGLGGSFTPAGKDADGKVKPGKIKINAAGQAFKDPREAIRTIVHEARHAYQDSQANASGTDYQQMCNYNNNNYNGSRGDYVRYGEQFIERDSRTFGQNTTNRLIGRLNQAWGH